MYVMYVVSVIHVINAMYVMYIMPARRTYNVSFPFHTMHCTMYENFQIQCIYEAVTQSARMYACTVHRRPGWKFRFPDACKNSLKAALSIYDFVTFWSETTDGSFSWHLRHTYLQGATYVHFTIQRMGLSPYSVWASPHTMYV